MKISEELFQEMLNCSMSVVCLVCSMVNYDGHLQRTMEDMKFLNMLKIMPRKNQYGGNVKVDPGTPRSCLLTQDGYPTDNPGLKR